MPHQNQFLNQFLSQLLNLLKNLLNNIFANTLLKIATRFKTLPYLNWGRYLIISCSLTVLLFTASFLAPAPSLASLTDDRFDGNIFALYAGNGSLVPPRESLKESFDRNRPVIITFFVDDSQDCKKFAGVISQLQQYYGKVAAFTPINADTILPQPSYEKTDPGYYYKGLLPQTVILDQEGKIVFDGTGQIKYEVLDDVFREVFHLLPRTESVELKQRAFNEVNTELAP